MKALEVKSQGGGTSLLGPPPGSAPDINVKKHAFKKDNNFANYKCYARKQAKR